MSLKCSIFGCDYGDSEVEREREEDGSEVVITITETETCRRCGDTRVVSENKEVTTLETAADIVADDLEDDGREADETEPGDAEGVDTGPVQEAEPTEEPTDEASVDASEDDAVILDDEQATDTERDPGEWPDDEETVTQENPDGSVEDEDGDDAGERDPGEWPEEPDDGDDDWQPETELEQDTTVEPTGKAVTVPEGTFHCPECGHTTDVESSSLREGDFCPECHRGSLEHRSE